MIEEHGSGQVTESGHRVRHVLVTLTGGNDDTDIFAVFGLGIDFKHIQRVSNLGANPATMAVRHEKNGEPLFIAAMNINLYAGTTDIERAALARDNIMVRGTHIRFVGTGADTIDLELVFD